MLVRPADPADNEAIAVVHVGSWRLAYRGQVPDVYLDSLSVEGRAEAWREIIAASDLPRTGVFVLKDNSRVVGFAHIAASRDEDASPDSGEVTSIYLAPTVWRRGGGRLLMQVATRSLRSAGFARATLWVLETNAQARQFYEAMGWRPDGARKIGDHGGFALGEVRYRLEL